MTWTKAIGFVLHWEAGYVNDPNDPGGETNFGISKASYPNVDIKALTQQQAEDIYFRDYWKASGADTLIEGLDLLVLDTAVLCGVGAAKAMLANARGSVAEYAVARALRHAHDPNFARYGLGWFRRLFDAVVCATDKDLK